MLLNNKNLHPKNKHKDGYDYPLLIKGMPELNRVVNRNQYGNWGIDFSDPIAVTLLNAAILKQHYQINDWKLPEGALCPPIPGRADYILYLADLLAEDCQNKTIKLLDIGTGASGIYPILASQIFGWHCVGSDINKLSLDNVTNILSKNPSLSDHIELRIQANKDKMFVGIIKEHEFFDITMCNPPFHSSLEEANKGSKRKQSNLALNKQKQIKQSKDQHAALTSNTKPLLNFGGKGAELWCNGGERLFLKKMIKESKIFALQCRWFSTLISKKENLKPAIKLINKLGAKQVREIEMKQGNKITRILVWNFNDKK